MQPSRLILDEYVKVECSNDRLQAYFYIGEVNRSIQFSQETIIQFLHNYGVIKGIDSSIVRQLADHMYTFSGQRVLVAEGKKSQAGADGSICYHIPIDDTSSTPLHREDGSVDYREVRSIRNVKKGQLLAEKRAPTQGIDGYTVMGENLTGKRGRPAMMKAGKNVVMNEEQTKIYSLIEGVFTFTDAGKINVFPIYEVAGDVDYDIGNIDFVGTVVIRGDVLNGFKIKADGDIRVTGGVEGAELVAGGSIYVNAGILGFNKTLIKAGKSVECAFIRDAIVKAYEDVIVKQSIMHSTISAGNAVKCEGAHGVIVGGKVQASQFVVARTIGNLASTQTTIELGVHPELRNELNTIRPEYIELLANLEKTEKALHLLNQMYATGKLDEQKIMMRSRLLKTEKQYQVRKQEIQHRILEIEKVLEKVTVAKLEVKGTVYSGTKIVIGRSIRLIKEPISKIVFQIADGGNISIIPIV